MTRTEAIVAIVKDHTYGRHVADHPDCPVCAQRPEMPEWVRRAQARTLPAKARASLW